MKKTLSLIFIFITTNVAFAQTNVVDTLIVSVSQKNRQDDKLVLKFPIIKTGNAKTDLLINNDLKKKYFDYEFPDLSTKEIIRNWTNDLLVDLNFEVTYLKNDIISFHIIAESCGAYCSNWTKYFTYNLKTGNQMFINDFFLLNEVFVMQIMSDKNHQFELQTTELKEIWLDKNSGIDKSTYDWALNQYEGCKNDFEINSFVLFPDHLEIILDCSLPNAIKNLTPIIEMKYNYKEIEKFMKMKLN